MNAFQELLRSSKNIIAVAGAGLSAASGIQYSMISLDSTLLINSDQASQLSEAPVGCGASTTPYLLPPQRASVKTHPWSGNFITTDANRQ